MVLPGRRIRGFIGVLSLTFMIMLPAYVTAETATNEFAMFKRTISPAWLWGENGELTIPKATPIGKYNFYAAMSGQDAGQIQGEKLYNTNTSFVFGTSDDAEIGYTKRQLYWANGDRTDLKSDVFHIKARVLNLAESFIPQLSVGVIGMSLKDNQFTSTSEILFNPFAAATINVPLFSEHHVLSITATAETLYADGESTDTFYNAGADLSLFDRKLIIAVEQQGIGKTDSKSIMNAGVKLKLWDFLSLGAGKFNMSKSAVDKTISQANSYTMFFVSLELPLGRWSKAKSE